MSPEIHSPCHGSFRDLELQHQGTFSEIVFELNDLTLLTQMSYINTVGAIEYLD